MHFSVGFCLPLILLTIGEAREAKKSMGLDITIVTSAETDDEGRDLLRLLGMPFRRTEAAPAPKPHAA